MISSLKPVFDFTQMSFKCLKSGLFVAFSVLTIIAWYVDTPLGHLPFVMNLELCSVPAALGLKTRSMYRVFLLCIRARVYPTHTLTYSPPKLNVLKGRESKGTHILKL